MSLLDPTLAGLTGLPTQDNRLLKLHTALGTDVLVAERVEIDEAIGPVDETVEHRAGTRLVVHTVAGDAHLELKQLIGQPALLELLTSQSLTDLRGWHGHVTQAAFVGGDGGLARYRLVIEPWLSALAHRRDSWVFQNQTVQQIIDEVFADYQGAGMLAPAWRWDLADASVYPVRSICIQYQESDLQFVYRLLREEGLFCWYEHEGDPDDAILGSHTLVIADHNDAFTANPQAEVRYTQSGSALQEDSLTEWEDDGTVHSASLELASPDYVTQSLREVEQTGIASEGEELNTSLTQSDVPGAYAYEDSQQGARLAERQMQALDALREQASGGGSWRTAAPGTTFTLTDHPIHDGSDTDRDRFVILAVHHSARSNVSADVKANLQSLPEAIAGERERAEGDYEGGRPGPANESEEPVYECQLTVQRAAVPVRIAGIDEDGMPDPRIHPRPTIQGVQTAIVVGAGGPIDTDRDHRIKVQFHWQRGNNASHRLNHPSGGDNAPASDASGSWVRVGESVAGSNWGANFTPRLGQEVLVAFDNGDIDRPSVVGSAYNGKGQPNAQANQAAGGAATATGNAPAWFPGDQAEGKLQGHQHDAVLVGFKSQELATSQGGTGGYNQLVLDGTPQAARLELASSSAGTRLQLGLLIQQSDNQRLQPRGHGLDLTTAAWGAARAGSGILLSGYGRPGSQSGGNQLDAREAQTQLQQAQDLHHSLAESAQAQNAKLEGEPAVAGATKDDTAKQLATEQGLYASQDSIGATDQRGDSGSGDEQSIGGGAGTVAAWSRPDLIAAAPGGVAAYTPAGAVYSAGNTVALISGQDLHHLAQANHATAVKDGLILYTYGVAGNASKPNTETGIKLHAASGSVSMQSQSGATRLTADQAIEVSSVNDTVRVTGPQQMILTAGGAAIDIQAGSITLKGPGSIEFKAAMKELTGPGSASQSLELKKPGELALCPSALADAATSGASVV